MYRHQYCITTGLITASEEVELELVTVLSRIDNTTGLEFLIKCHNDWKISAGSRTYRKEVVLNAITYVTYTANTTVLFNSEGMVGTTTSTRI